MSGDMREPSFGQPILPAPSRHKSRQDVTPRQEKRHHGRSDYLLFAGSGSFTGHFQSRRHDLRPFPSRERHGDFGPTAAHLVGDPNWVVDDGASVEERLHLGLVIRPKGADASQRYAKS